MAETLSTGSEEVCKTNKNFGDALTTKETKEALDNVNITTESKLFTAILKEEFQRKSKELCGSDRQHQLISLSLYISMKRLFEEKPYEFLFLSFNANNIFILGEEIGLDGHFSENRIRVSKSKYAKLIRDRGDGGSGLSENEVTLELEKAYITAQREYVEAQLDPDHPENIHKGQTLNDFLDSRIGLPESTKEILATLIAMKGFKVPKDQISVVEKNLKEFIKLFANIESGGGKNVENAKSSAKGPLQVIDGHKDFEVATDNEDIRVFDRNIKDGKTATFDLFLINAMEGYYRENDIDIPLWILDAYEHQPFVSPLTLTHEQTMNLFLLGYFSRNYNTYFKDIMLKGDIDRVGEFYEKIHHTKVGEHERVALMKQKKEEWSFAEVNAGVHAVPATVRTKTE